MRKINIIFYAVNGLGLGHVTRLLSIARQWKKNNPLINPIFLTSSESCNLIFQHGFAYYKVPSKNIAKENNLSMNDLALTYQQIINMLVMTYNPKMLVVDTFPLGSLKDLTGILQLTSFKKVFIHREQKEEKMTPSRVKLQNLYDFVITPHKEGEANIPVPKNKDLFWCPNIMIRERGECLSSLELKRKHNIPLNKKIIYLNLGGGGDPTINKNYEKILSILNEREDIHIVMGKSPLARNEDYSSKNLTILDHYPMIEKMPMFDCAISAAGYNTFHELLYMGIPSIFIPKTRGYDDQESRVLSAEKKNLCLFLSEDNINKRLLNKLINKAIENKDDISKKCKSYVSSNGAIDAAYILDSKISSKKLKIVA